MSGAVLWTLIGMVLASVIVFLRRSFFDFAAQKAADYQDSQPVFDMRRHLNGKLICEGVIFGPMGRMTSSFVARFNARWNGDICVIDEHFTYDSGDTQQRQWKIAMGQGGAFEATASDVPGTAQGAQAGAVVLFRYPIKMPPSAGGYVLTAFDCMYLTAEGTIVNRSQFRKFGIKVAELVATIRPEENK